MAQRTSSQHGWLTGLGLTLAGAMSLSTAAGSFAAPKDDPDSTVQATRVGLIELEETLEERPGPMGGLFAQDHSTTLRKVVTMIEDAGRNEEMDSLVIRLRGVSLGLTQVEELGDAISHARALGKKIHLFSEYYETPELLLGSYADEVLIQSGGPVSLPGLYGEEMYLADTLAWAGLKAELVQVGDYKGANEALVNAAPTPAWSQNIESLMDSLYAIVRARLKAGRNMNDQKLDDAMRVSWMALDKTAQNAGLVDSILDLPDLSAHLENAYASGVDWKNILNLKDDQQAMDMSNPFAIFAQLGAKRKKELRRDTIAVVHIDGPIVDGESTSGGFGGESQVGSWTIRRTLSEIEDNDKVKGVVIRINSPGGSAIASEIMWQGFRRVAERKPVWVSVGSMAASGGYYLAVAGDKIYVNPSSIVGSIGVVGGKISMSGMFDHLKIKTVSRSRGPMSGLLSSSKPWSDAERKLVRDKMIEIYDLFTQRVSAGRDGIDLSKTAEGRLFTGDRAVELDMADKLGGLNVAIRDLAEELDLTQGRFDVLDYPEPKTFADILGEMLGGMAAAPNTAVSGSATNNPAKTLVLGAVRELVGEDAWPQVRDSLAALMQLRKEPVVLALPSSFVIKRR